MVARRRVLSCVQDADERYYQGPIMISAADVRMRDQLEEVVRPLEPLPQRRLEDSDDVFRHQPVILHSSP
jgi:hypothetical protein